MRFKILFSIPVHEKFDVILDQIVNILTLNEACAVILHVSPVFQYTTSKLSMADFLTALRSNGFSNSVFINPTSVRTGWFDIIQAHLHNFKFAFENIDFEYFSLLSSNELFIKNGTYKYVSHFDCSGGGF